MNASEIIKSIEAEQLKAEVPEFRVGDTVKVYGKIKEGNRERIQVFELRNRVEATVKHSQLERFLTDVALRKPGLYILQTLKK